MNLSRATLLLLVTGFLGVLTSFMPLIPRGLMGAALAVVLSLGTICVSWRQSRTRKAPEQIETVMLGLLSGLAGGALAAAIQFLLPAAKHDFVPPPTPAWNLVLSATLYGIALHLSARRPTLGNALLWSALTCFAVRVLCGLTLGMEPLAVIFLALFGAVPFGVLWTLATVKLTSRPTMAWTPVTPAAASPASCPGRD